MTLRGFPSTLTLYNLRHAIFFIFTLIIAERICFCQLSTTIQSDIDALLSFKAALNSTSPDTSVLTSWAPSTDPCRDKWEGIACTCDSLNLTTPSSLLVNCSKEYNANAELRILQLSLPGAAIAGKISPSIADLTDLLLLDLSSSGIRQALAEGSSTGSGGQDAAALGPGPGLSGPLPVEIAALSQLQVLDLSNNRLSGSIPGALGNIDTLRALILTGNNFTGNIPTTLGTQRNLTELFLDGNFLTGSLPSSWCTPVDSTATQVEYRVSNNPGLCGRVPANCSAYLNPLSISGTSLYWTRSQLLSGVGGTCDVTPPNCASLVDPHSPCQLSVESYLGNNRQVIFNSTEVIDAESDILSYFWGVGTQKGLMDVLGQMPMNTTSQWDSRANSPRIYMTSYTLPPGLILMDGQPYYITVAAANAAAPRLWCNISSDAVLVDTMPPMVAWVRIPGDVPTTSNLTGLTVQWSAYDAGSGIATVQLELVDVTGKPPHDTVALYTLPDNKGEFSLNWTLTDGHTYQWTVTALDNAKLKTSVNSTRVTVVSASDKAVGTNTFAITVVLTAVGALILGSVVALLVMRGRIKQQNQKEKDKQRELKQMKALMYALTNAHASSTAPKLKADEGLRNCKDFAFVVTDVESSTEQSTNNPVAFSAMQDIHDQVMREGIAKYNGYEIITEGDSFSIAFLKISDAVQFCLDTQYRLLETNWPRAVLKLPSCKPVVGPDGELIFKGPRIRMGVHWATEGTVAHRLHNLTKQRIFQGPGWVLAQEIGEIAYGGQVVLSHEGWLALRENMPDAGFPVVHQIGRYVLSCSPQQPMWIYNISEVIGRPLPRKFDPPLRKGQKLCGGLGLHIMPPPKPKPGSMLTFAALRLTTFPTNRSILPPSVANKLEEVIAMQAQQFKGYMYYLHKSEGRFYLAFEQVMDAMRFCHATQMLLMYTKWPEEAEDFSGQAVPNPDGRWIFKGPRVAMAVHESDDFQVLQLSMDRLPAHEEVMEYGGTAHQQVSMLAQVIRGGQVVLSERAWDSIKGFLAQHPGAAQCCSLGTHIVDTFSEPLLLLEVMPNMLARRNFKPPATRRMLEPGYREAPSSNEAMAVVFVKVQKPKEVVMAETVDENMREEEVVAAITEYQVAVQQYTTIARKLLRVFDGYECKEPEPGKFTLVFRKLSDAVRWSVAVQVALLKIEWSEGLLKMEECARHYDMGNNLIWSGLRVRMGMAYGFANSKKPLNSGRADYFGVLPNTAARVMAQAAPGQVLVESSGALISDLGLLMREDQATWISDGLNSKEDLMTDSLLNVLHAIELKPLGYFSLKGIEDLKLIFQATHASLLSRQFPTSPELVREPGGSGTVRRLSGTKRSGNSKWPIIDWISQSKPSWLLRRSLSKSFGKGNLNNELPLYITSGGSSKSSQVMQGQTTTLSVPNMEVQLRQQQSASSLNLQIQSPGSVSHRTISMPQVAPQALQESLVPLSPLPSLGRENGVRFDSLVDADGVMAASSPPMIHTAASVTDSTSECPSPSSSYSPMASPMTPPGKIIHIHQWMFPKGTRETSFSSALTSGSGNSSTKAKQSRNVLSEKQVKKWNARKLKHVKIMRTHAGLDHHKRTSSFASISSPADTPRSTLRLGDNGSLSSSPSPRAMKGHEGIFAQEVARAYLHSHRRSTTAHPAGGSHSETEHEGRIRTAGSSPLGPQPSSSFPPRAMSMSQAQTMSSFARPPTVERTRSMDRPSRQTSLAEPTVRRTSASDPEMMPPSDSPKPRMKPKPLNLSVLPPAASWHHPDLDGNNSPSMAADATSARKAFSAIVQGTDGSVSEGSASYSPRTALQAQRIGVPHSHMTHLPSSPLRPVDILQLQQPQEVHQVGNTSPKSQAGVSKVVSRLKRTFSWSSRNSG